MRCFLCYLVLFTYCVFLCIAVVSMAPQIDALEKITPDHEAWRVKTRIVRMWLLSSYTIPSVPAAIEMVLMDEFGCKMQATIKKTLIYKFNPILVEGGVYQFAYFSVAPNTGFYRTTKHEFRLIFQFKTIVKPCDSVLIPLHGFTFTPLEEVIHTDPEYPFLVDVIGLLTGVGTEKVYEKDGKMTKMIVIEISAEGVKLEYALFGNYVDELNGFNVDGNLNRPVVAVQFAKVKSFKGKIVIQNVLYVSRILFNPDIAKANALKGQIIEDNIVGLQNIPVLGDGAQYSIHDDFLQLNLGRTIQQLIDCTEEGFYIVLATIKEVIKDGDWFYPACRCNKAVVADSGMYYCDRCFYHIVNVVPRYRIKVRVCDNSASAVFVLFDRDGYYMLKKSCSDMVAELKKPGVVCNYPSELDSWVGKTLLFKVEIKDGSLSTFDTSYTVRRVCDDETVLNLFGFDGRSFSHDKGLQLEA